MCPVDEIVYVAVVNKLDVDLLFNMGPDFFWYWLRQETIRKNGGTDPQQKQDFLNNARKNINKYTKLHNKLINK